MHLKPVIKAAASLCACAILLLPLLTLANPPLPVKKPRFDTSNERSAGMFNFIDAFDRVQKAERKPKPAAKPKAQTAQNTKIPLPTRKPAHTAKAAKPQFAALSNADKSHYREIFTLQENANFTAAATQVKALSDKRLVGHVLHHRYMHPKYATSKKELKSWLEKYATHPYADKIHALALKKGIPESEIKKPQNPITLKRRQEPTMSQSLTYVSAQPRQTDPIEQDIAAAKTAASLLYDGDIDNAYAIAARASARSKLHVPLAGWIAGLSAWMKGDPATAAPYFELAARSQYASGWTKAAGAYWAARAHSRAKNKTAAAQWLARAAEYPRTFYGLIAMQHLNRIPDFNWDTPSFTKAHFKTLSENKAGFRALALAQIGQTTRAQDEFLRLDYKTANLRSAAFAFAHHTGLPRLSMRLAPYVKTQNAHHDAAIYPLSPWQPKGGYKTDPALIHAIIRQESRFEPNSESPSGAKGLMQIMPATAAELAGYKNPATQNPILNLSLGQQYLQTLLQTERVNNDLTALLIAYNAGPGNLGKWQGAWADINDPLLFIELLPSSETRSYVERVLSNYWIYRLRAGQPLNTLTALIKGQKMQIAALTQ
ncbi:MAG: lytic transglycosylase domain-containing protein [Alphaproteobacteria bacterium]